MNSSPQSPGHTAPPPDALLPFVHGLGSVLQQEHALLASLQRHPPIVSGPHAEDLARIVARQRTVVADTVALIEARCRMLPQASRFAGMGLEVAPVDNAFASPPAGNDALAQLVDRHTKLMRELGALDELRGGWDPATPLLREAAHNHEEMAWVLMALIHENETACAWPELAKAASPADTSPAQANWENEGGPPDDTRVTESDGAAPHHGSR